jgi:hypothetical protein
LTAIKLSAGTSSANLSAVTFSNSNAISFGLNGSTVTAAFGGMSSWTNGPLVSSGVSSNCVLSLQPIIVPYNLTVTNLIWFASLSAATNSSGALSVSVGIYTLNGGTTGSLSLASSSSSNYTWTSAAQYSSSSGPGYRMLSVASWALTPGPYLLAFWGSSANAGTFGIYNTASGASIASGLVSLLTNQMLPGFWATSFGTAMPSSFSLSDTAGYRRTGASVWAQPWMVFQGT